MTMTELNHQSWLRSCGSALLPAALAVLLGLVLVPTPALAQDAEGKTIVDMVIEGNQRVSDHRILRLMTLAEGATYTAEAANEDFKRLFGTGEFGNVDLVPEEVPGGVRLRVVLAELPVLQRIEFIGVKNLDPKKLRELAGLRSVEDEQEKQEPLNPHALLSAVPIMEDEYRRKGFYFVEIVLDRTALEQESVARFVVSEGPKVYVDKIVFRGNESLDANQLEAEIETKKGFWFFSPGVFSLQTLEADVARIRAHYVDHGFFDAEVSRQFTFDEKNENVEVEFIIAEGPRYTVASIAIQGAEPLATAYVAGSMALEVGEAFDRETLDADAQNIQRLYGRIGYVHARVTTEVDFAATEHQVDLVITIDAGPKIILGEIHITGNPITQDKVILRQLRFEPLQVADQQEIERAKRRLVASQLFSQAEINLVPTEDPNVEDVAIHVEEARTAQFLIGAGVSSNSGLIGSISLQQKNFDASRWPRGWDDPGAFRGAGQTFRFYAEPGTELSTFGVGFTEPALFDKPIRFDGSGQYFERDRGTYEEQRLGGQMAIGKNFTHSIFASVGFRMENIEIASVTTSAPTDIVAVAGKSLLSAVTVRVVRDLTDNYFIPTTGSRVSATFEQAGALGGDYAFTKLVFDGRRYWTVTEDALGRRSVFNVRGRLGLALNDPPIFERFYAGGQGTIRGFNYRGVGPFERGEPVGGDFLALLGAEYEFPIVGQNFRGVVFLDSGTVEADTEITTYRISPGFGLRFNVDMLGAPVPFALDFGFPLATGDDDETENISFSIAWSF